MTLQPLASPGSWTCIPHAQTWTLTADDLQERDAAARLHELERLQRHRASDLQLSQLARTLATMYEAGLPFDRALESAAGQAETLEWGLILSFAHRDLQHGRSILEAFGAFPHVFGPTWLALMRRAMEDGGLGDALTALADLHERAHLLRTRIRAACFYPLLVFSVSLLVAVGAFVFVLPPMLASITSSGRPLPMATQVLVFVMNVATNPLLLVASPFLIWANVAAFRRFLRSERGRMRFDHLKCSLPIVGPLARKIAVARLLHTLKASLASGVRLTLALELAGAASGNALYFLHALRCVQGLRDGEPLSALLVTPTRLYAPMVAYSVRIGEECGQLERMVESLRQYYDLEVSTALENLLTSLEPLLLLATGAVVAFIVLAVFLPLYASVGSGV